MIAVSTGIEIQEVIDHLETLPQDVQEQVLAPMRALVEKAPRGVAGSQLLQFAGLIPRAELDRMTEAIDQGCEQVDPDEW